MSVNREKPHLLILPEDKKDSDIANGFLLYEQLVAPRQVQVLRYSGGYPRVKQQFLEIYLHQLRKYNQGHLVLLVDFDGKENRLAYFADDIPEDLKERVFVLGCWSKPEDLTKNRGAEVVGKKLAHDCHQNPQETLWKDPLLAHNQPEKDRMAPVREILFGAAP